ncbi:MAG: DNA-3-methyladenine glycosylase [Thermoplasmata archaeon]
MDWARAFRHPRPRSWYDRPTIAVARAILGDWLVGRTTDGWRAGRIVETEAYGANDPASHAFRGPTARNRSMFADPGTWYVYRIHQVHCANLTTRPGEAILLRALEPATEGLGDTRGPGRLCRAFGLTRAEDGSSAVLSPRLRVLPGPRSRAPVVSGPRVGIRRAPRRRLRFALKGNRWVSSPRPSGWTG